MAPPKNRAFCALATNDARVESGVSGPLLLLLREPSAENATDESRGRGEGLTDSLLSLLGASGTSVRRKRYCRGAYGQRGVNWPSARTPPAATSALSRVC